MITTTLSRPDVSSPAFGRRWRAFAAACGASFFQDWTWVGCLAAERYSDPVLVEAVRDGRTVGMALFNRRSDRPWGQTLYLHESGMPEWDATFIEHNGLLLADPAGGDASVLLRAALAGSARRRLVLSGVGPETLRAAATVGGAVHEQATRRAPYVDLRRLGSSTLIESLSRNTRHQLRRSNRDYASIGALRLRRAETVEEGLAQFAELVRLHDITWRGRGAVGAFAGAAVRLFHHELIATGIPRGEVDLLQLRAGEAVVGYLMNFRHCGVVSAYQSGFDYAGAGVHMKPGLTSHFLAISHAIETGACAYDFLAGPSRYKESFANAERSLHWLSVGGRMHPKVVRQSGVASLQKMRNRLTSSSF